MSATCECTAKECAASKCFDCQKYLAEPNFALKCLITSIHGSHHVGDAQHARLYQIFDAIDKLGGVK